MATSSTTATAKKRGQSARPKNWREWTVDETHEWAVTQIGKDVADLLRKHKINGVVLAKLKEQDLRQPPIAMTVFGDMKVRVCLCVCVARNLVS